MTDSEQPAPTRWSEVFRRSTISPVVFNVRKESTEAVVEALRTASLRRVTHRTTLGSPASSGDEAYAATAILDGYVVELLKRWGLPVGDSLRSGMRVVGTDPMRLLSLLLELQPPTRSLKGEERVPATKDLLTGLAEQTRQSDAQLDSAAERGIGIRDASELLKLVIDLYGEAAVPNPPNALLAKLPGEGEWGEAGFNRFQQKRFESELIQVSDATKWRDIGFDFIEIIGAKGLAIEQGRRFRELGYRPYQVLRMSSQSPSLSLRQWW